MTSATDAPDDIEMGRYAETFVGLSRLGKENCLSPNVIHRLFERIAADRLRIRAAAARIARLEEALRLAARRMELRAAIEPDVLVNGVSMRVGASEARAALDGHAGEPAPVAPRRRTAPAASAASQGADAPPGD